VEDTLVIFPASRLLQSKFAIRFVWLPLSSAGENPIRFMMWLLNIQRDDGCRDWIEFEKDLKDSAVGWREA